MKALMLAASAAVLAVALPVASQAQSLGPMFTPTQVYGTLGYLGQGGAGADLGAIQGRVGARFGPYFGVEGEGSGGVRSDVVGVGAPTAVSLSDQVAAYGVGYLPLGHHIDLFARLGYGHTDYRAEQAGIVTHPGVDSVNYGGGAEYMFTGKDGIRADYTREDAQDSHFGDANTWALAYVHKF